MNSLLHAAIDADIPVLLWGAPGIGKTAYISDVAESRHIFLEVLIGSQTDPTEVGGVMVDRDGRLAQEAPPWAMRVRAALDEGREAWLFLDELNTAPRSVQAALLRVVQNRVVANVDISGCKIIAAANPPDLVPDGIELAAATANRWVHINQTPDPRLWAAGMMRNWGKSQSPTLAAIRGVIADYIRKNTGAILAVPRDIDAQGRAWPSPRSWDNLSVLLSQLPGGLHGMHTRAAASSLVGPDAADQFMAWLEESDLPDPVDMLRCPDTCELPSTRDRTETALHSCVAYVMSLHGEAIVDMWESLWTLIQRVPKDVGLSAASAALQLRGDKNFLRIPDYAIELHKALQAAS